MRRMNNIKFIKYLLRRCRYANSCFLDPDLKNIYVSETRLKQLLEDIKEIS